MKETATKQPKKNFCHYILFYSIWLTHFYVSTSFKIKLFFFQFLVLKRLESDKRKVSDLFSMNRWRLYACMYFISFCFILFEEFFSFFFCHHLCCCHCHNFYGITFSYPPIIIASVFISFRFCVCLLFFRTKEIEMEVTK